MSTLTSAQFRMIAEIARDRWGLDLPDKKISTVTARLNSFVRKSHFDSVKDYLKHLKHEASEEDMIVFFDILSTNVTSFFRDRAHFDYIEREFLTALDRGNITTPGRRIRIWSAGCSTGPEPYSLGITALEHLRDAADWDLKILATDLSNSAIQKAKNAVYPLDQVEAIPSDVLRRHFRRGTGDKRDFVRVADHLRNLVTVRRLNLMDPWPFKGPFNIIFCRNVMIYFDHDTREQLVNRFHDMLTPGGIFAVGSSETLSGLNTPFKSVQASMYVRS